ncbi:YbaK/EbsC family protein [Microlunatus panaciterrae]|uniref:Prolyl-tRNA editing enzyme YbaK/EbsC (Cys-tRNA(Pro) deacylase) n=1 Tax=Microlunatus panaciterrae TaxID=400768 RepID=A0ABS2RHC5_9ACTN|nr:YbaK/EbsC family protein [Microlunatus panaciterrae]MBM7797932.1 prolyl-tRNA editing enzyme YbaK/EbsC (Cys-tRNA(Pro) deacylase) [Microlunatus panaciterrae]
MPESPSDELHPNCQRVNQLLQAHGLPGRVRLLAEPAPTAKAAADQLGCDIGAIANSLVFTTSAGEPLLVMTSGAHRVDQAVVGELLGQPIRRATPDFVRQHTGQPIGGVAPIGHPAPVRTLVDRDLSAFELLWAAGGIPHAVFPLSYRELVLITGGTEASVA